MDWTVFHPTKELKYDIEFSQGYAICDPRLEVRVGSTGRVSPDEERDRLLARISFLD